MDNQQDKVTCQLMLWTWGLACNIRLSLMYSIESSLLLLLNLLEQCFFNLSVDVQLDTILQKQNISVLPLTPVASVQPTNFFCIATNNCMSLCGFLLSLRALSG